MPVVIHQLLLSSNIFLDDGSYHHEIYTKLQKPDYQKHVPNLSYCLSLCSVNQTCAAAFYNESTSVCYMSGVSAFINIHGKERKAFRKSAHTESFSLIEGIYYKTNNYWMVWRDSALTG